MRVEAGLLQKGPRIRLPQGLGLAGILLIYLLLGALYATGTPPWQNPDEPAHFNYVQDLAQGQGLPVLQPGDYDFAYLEGLKAAKFPLESPTVSLRYEGHQPPLYYLLAAPLAKAAAPLSLPHQVVLLRFFSLLWGVVLLILVYQFMRLLFPQDHLLALSVPGFLALVPQHVAITAAINNDVLAEVMVALTLLVLCFGMARGFSSRWFPDHPRAGSRLSWLASPLGLGLLLGLALLTKTTAYHLLGLAPLALLLSGERRWRSALAWLGRVYGVALAVSGWWFLRNLWMYGNGDLLGLARHAQVVAGQPVAQAWDLEVLQYLITVSFKSFWAQLGWMGVPAEGWVYALLAAVTGVSGIGLALFALRAFREPDVLLPFQRQVLALLALATVLVLGQMLLYNLQFLQPQGRYLFPSLTPMALCFLLGFQEWVRPRYRALAHGLLLAGLLLLNVYTLTTLLPLLRP